MSKRIDLEQRLRYDGDALVPIDGERMYSQRVQRLALMDPDALYHRPGIGGGMRRFQNRPPHPELLQQQLNSFTRFLDALPFVEKHEVSLRIDRALAAGYYTIRAKIDGDELLIRDIEV